MAVLVDTGPLVALADRSDRWHARCLELFGSITGPILVPVPVLVEVCYLIQKGLGTRAEATFLDAVRAGEIELVPFSSADLDRATELVRQYADFPLGFVDAVVVATAERLGLHEVATVDRRHFAAVRPAHVEAFTLLP
ncbi:type II toxin-antitoxin system VapC family toxin [Jiangella muralis]|uniref:type II toxin-antitoxin system VapC family toxin n=1 Tax=Jiangella muralis TaxID=702383 RepID=UPI00069E887A|nr:PIN domain-containing protein [Jiangella muralis]